MVGNSFLIEMLVEQIAMPTNRTRANYDELNKIAQQWAKEEQATRQMLASLRQCMDVLQGGD